MTSRTIPAQDVLEAQQPQRPHAGRSHSQPSIGEPRSAASDSPPRVRTPTLITVHRILSTEYLSLMPRLGDKPLRRVTETQARSLLAFGLVEPICRSRRGEIVGLRVKAGSSVAAINSALRAGAGNVLPIAEDNRTIRRVSAEGGGVYYEQIRTAAWDDGRSDE